MKFTELTTTKLGTLAEDMLINEFVASKGYMPMTPSINGPHDVDAICTKRGCKTWALDVKAKSRLKYFSGTSIDRADYITYTTQDYPVYILIADMASGTAYGQWIDKLQLMNIPSIPDNLVTFPLSGMTYYRDLTGIEQETLKQYERSKYYD
jgi:hypothetical protein